VDLVLAVDGAVRAEGAGGFGDVMIGVSEDSMVGSIVGLVVGSATIGSMISTLESELSHFRFLLFSVVDERSAVTGTLIYMRLISFPARLQEDGEDMEHCQSRNIVICPPKSNWLIDRRQSQKVGVSKALS